MYAQATTTVTVRRGTTVDGFGDEVDTGAVAATGIPMSILQQRRAVSVPSDGRVQQVAWFTGRANAGTDLQVGDQLQDERAPTVFYRVDDVYPGGSPATTPDLTCSLRLVTS